MNIGTLIRSRRKERKLTLKNVAEKASISEGFLSQVENDVNSPSVETLIRICTAIGVDAGDLISRASRQTKVEVVRRSEWDDIDLSHTGFVTRRFFPPDFRTGTSGLLRTHIFTKTTRVRKNIKNAQEVLTILKGVVELTLGPETLPLSEGDSVHFWSNLDNQKITNNGTATSFALWVGTI